jgi:hypothetical protein
VFSPSYLYLFFNSVYVPNGKMAQKMPRFFEKAATQSTIATRQLDGRIFLLKYGGRRRFQRHL